MAGKTATLAIKIVGDASGARQAFGDAETAADRFSRGMDRASVAAAAGLAGVAALAKAAFDSASALEQATGAVEAVFGAQAGKVQELARGAAESAGLAASEYGNLATLIGSQLTNMGFAAEDVVPQTEQLINLGADLAAQYGGTTAEAVAAVSSALKGERDPIERYAASLTQAGIDAQIAAMGLDTSTEAAERNAQAQATIALITEQTASAQGAFAREADTAAGAQQRLSAQWENAKAALGEALLPVISAAAAGLSELAGWAAENTETVQVLVGVFTGLAATVIAVNAATRIWNTLQTIATALQWAWNIAVAANPLMLIVLAIVAVVAAIILAYQHFEGFRDLVDTVARAIGDFITRFIGDPLGTIRGLVRGVGDAFSSAMGGARNAVQWVIDKIQQLLDKLSNLPGAGIISDVVGFFTAPADPGGLVGAPAGLRAAAAGGLRAAGSSSSGAGGIGPAAGAGSYPGQTVVNVTVNGALDPVAVGRQITDLVRQYQVATGRSRTAVLGR